MALPPIHPLQVEGKDTNYFQILVRWASDILSKEQGITLSFKGYTDTLIEYANLKEEDVQKAWRLAKELNTWAEYFSSIANLIQKIYLDADTTKIEIQADASIQADVAKVSNGDRLANKDPRVVEARKKRNTLQAFFEELVSKQRFLERAHYHCKATYDTKFKTIPASPTGSSAAV